MVWILNLPVSLPKQLDPHVLYGLVAPNRGDFALLVVEAASRLEHSSVLSFAAAGPQTSSLAPPRQEWDISLCAAFDFWG